jgi:hypothetical protein
VDIPALVAGVAHLLGGVVDVSRAVELGEVSVDSFQCGTHLDLKF